MTDILQSLDALISDLHPEDDQIVDRVDQIRSIKDFDLEDLTDAQREQLIQKLTELSSRTMNMMSKLLEKNSGQELYLKDLEVNKNLHDVKQYTEFGLWRSLYKQNLLLHERIHRTMKRLSHATKQQETRSETQNENTTASTTFKDLYMEEITQSFGDELHALRQDEGFDGHKIQLLADFLEQGVKLYSAEEQEFIMSCFNAK